MSSREYILQQIKKNKPELAPLPSLPSFERNDVDLLTHFKETLKFVGGMAIELRDDQNINKEISKIYHDAKQIVSNTDFVSLANFDLTFVTDPHHLKDIDLAILKGEFGVAENAAVWIPANTLVHRALPFITQHVVFILEKYKLVWNMHEAYKKINLQNTDGYGVFISGPSKTADIEQSLVIGAHGSRSLTVFLI